MITPASALSSIQLGSQIGSTQGQGIGVGHFKNRRHAAQDCAPCTRFQILFVLQPRLSEMHLTVDHPWQNMQAIKVQHTVCTPAGQQITKSRNPALRTGDVETLGPIRCHYRSATEQQIGMTQSMLPGGFCSLRGRGLRNFWRHGFTFAASTSRASCAVKRIRSIM